ncbi:ATP-binding protein [Flectobacillus sp. DC10W]|jgi:two-component system phosphate regulon sensor histidine kinase PhoR|uniref:histidine kinase n=1 Tax=Flectobacillus longus TaxID=2984207 RepID=A0ABT6YPJ0_9BACT|nr:ATP-binding protein [Flectobacillus longus]MDI9865505.1 ATP-binding protein [Flectobacillus longus]
MLLNPKLLATLLSIVIAIFTTSFLSFLPEANANVLFICFIASFIIAGLLIYFTLDYLVFQEINKMYDSINRLKMKDFGVSRKKLYKNANPLKKLNDELFVYVSKKEQEVNELKRLEKYRREFLANVSHELKTPIFAAQGFVHTLLDGAMDDERVRVKFLTKAAKSLDGLDILVKDLLTLSQMETGDIRMNRERVDVKQITKEVFEQLESKAETKNVSLQIKSPESQVWVKADAQRIGQVITNLVENAIKYGNEDGKVLVLFEDEKKDWRISVKDNGPGIAPEHLSRIFERFYRVDKARSRSDGSSGLGLAIVKHILNAHKTKITVASKPDKGTSFSFKLSKE